MPMATFTPVNIRKACEMAKVHLPLWMVGFIPGDSGKTSGTALENLLLRMAQSMKVNLRTATTMERGGSPLHLRVLTKAISKMADSMAKVNADIVSAISTLAIKNGLPVGRGILTLATGIAYTGEFKAGFADGQGVLSVPGRGSYEGQFARHFPVGNWFICRSCDPI